MSLMTSGGAIVKSLKAYGIYTSEIVSPGAQKRVMINYERLKELLEFDFCEKLKTSHKKRIESCLERCDTL